MASKTTLAELIKTQDAKVAPKATAPLIEKLFAQLSETALESLLIDKIYPRLESKMIEILQEAKGDAGDQGIQGLTGAQGIQGDKGEKGDVGARGPRGEQGLPGKDGLDGKNGRNGKDGANGKDGKDGKDGKNGRNAPPIRGHSKTYFKILSIRGTIDGSNTDFYLSEAPVRGAELFLMLDNTRQQIVDASGAGNFTIRGNHISYAFAPQLGQTHWASVFRA